MNRDIASKANSSRRAVLVFSVLLVGFLLNPGDVRADWKVHDEKIYKANTKYYDTTSKDRWQKSYNQFKVKGATYVESDVKAVTFADRAKEKGVAESCPETKNPAGSDQLELCKSIVRTTNEQAIFLKDMRDVRAKRYDELKKALNERTGIQQDEYGKLEANTNRVTTLRAQLELDEQYTDNVMQSYGNRLTYLKGDQARLGKAAIDGEKKKDDGPVSGIGDSIRRTGLLAIALALASKEKTGD